jgi:hypothetical protein
MRPWTTGFPMKPRTDPVHIVQMATDDHSQAIVDCLASVVENTHRPLRYTLLTHGVICGDGSIMHNVKTFCEKHGIDYRHVPVSAKSIWRGNGTALKAVFPFFLPDVERVITLDYDLTFFDDIGKLWDVDLGDCIGALANENHHAFDLNGNSTCLPNNQCGIFNAGLGVWNVPQWRKALEAAGNEDAIAKECVGRPQRDQGIINRYFSDKLFYLPPTWNAVNAIEKWTRERKIRPPDVFEYASRSPAVYHQAGTYKKFYQERNYCHKDFSLRRRREMIDLGMNIVPSAPFIKSLIGLPICSRDTVFCVHTHLYRKAQRHGIRQSWGKELCEWDLLLFYCGSHNARPSDTADMVIADIPDADVNNTKILRFLLQVLEDSGIEYKNVFLCGDETWIRPKKVSELSKENADIVTETNTRNTPADEAGGIFLTRKAVQAFLETNHAAGAWVRETLWWATKDTLTWKGHNGLGRWIPFSGEINDPNKISIRVLSPDQMRYASHQEKNIHVLECHHDGAICKLHSDGGTGILGTWGFRHEGGVASNHTTWGTNNYGEGGRSARFVGNMNSEIKRPALLSNHEKDPKWVVCYYALLSTVYMDLKFAANHYLAAGAEKVFVYVSKIPREWRAGNKESLHTDWYLDATKELDEKTMWDSIHKWASKEPRIEFIDAGGGQFHRKSWQQDRTYGSCVKKIRGNGYWMLIVDMDEYLTLTPGLTMGSLLRDAESSPFRIGMIAFTDQTTYRPQVWDKEHPSNVHTGIKRLSWKCIVRVDDIKEISTHPSYSMGYNGRRVDLDVNSGFLLHRNISGKIEKTEKMPWGISDFLTTPADVNKRPLWVEKNNWYGKAARWLIDSAELKKPFQIPSTPVPASRLRAFVITTTSVYSEHRRAYFEHDWKAMNCQFQYVYAPYGAEHNVEEIARYAKLGEKRYARQRAGFIHYLRHTLDIMNKDNLTSCIWMEDDAIPEGNANWEFLETLLLDKRPDYIDVVALARQRWPDKGKDTYPLCEPFSEFIRLEPISAAAGMVFATKEALEFALKCNLECQMPASDWWVGEFAKQGGIVAGLPYTVSTNGGYASMIG